MTEFIKNYYLSNDKVKNDYAEYLASAIVSFFSLRGYKQIGNSLTGYVFEDGRLNILSFQKHYINIPDKFHIDDKVLYSVESESRVLLRSKLPVSIFDGGSKLNIMEVPFELQSYKINNVGGFLNTTGEKDNFTGICSINGILNVRTLGTVQKNCEKLIEVLKLDKSFDSNIKEKKDDYSKAYINNIIRDFTSLSLGVA